MARVLIIDDDQVSRVQIGTLLEAAGHVVHYAADGKVAIELYGREPFDLCLVDLVMPVKNGLQTIKELVALDSEARIIAITGVSPENLDMAKEFGARVALTKPVSPPDLAEAVGQALGPFDT